MSLACDNMKDLPWPGIGNKVTINSPKRFIAWNAVEGLLDGPDENFQGTIVEEGDEIQLREWTNFGTIHKDGKVIGKY